MGMNVTASLMACHRQKMFGAGSLNLAPRREVDAILQRGGWREGERFLKRWPGQPRL